MFQVSGVGGSGSGSGLMPSYSGSPGLPPLKGGDIGGGLVPQGSPSAGSVGGGGGQPQDLDCTSAVDPTANGGGYDKSPNPWKYQSFQVL